jgi:hypothetical protein
MKSAENRVGATDHYVVFPARQFCYTHWRRLLLCGLLTKRPLTWSRLLEEDDIVPDEKSYDVNGEWRVFTVPDGDNDN